MPSFQDSAVIFVIALLLFGPKKLPELARQLGKLMGEFRRASNDFRMQMEDELRMSEQAERQKEIAAMQAAAPVTPALSAPANEFVPADNYPAEEHPHLPPVVVAETEHAAEVLPIATSGELKLMPPATGLPVGRGVGSASALGPLLEAIPESGLEAAANGNGHGGVAADVVHASGIGVDEETRVDRHG